MCSWLTLSVASAIYGSTKPSSDKMPSQGVTRAACVTVARTSRFSDCIAIILSYQVHHSGCVDLSDTSFALRIDTCHTLSTSPMISTIIPGCRQCLHPDVTYYANSKYQQRLLCRASSCACRRSEWKSNNSCV